MRRIILLRLLLNAFALSSLSLLFVAGSARAGDPALITDHSRDTAYTNDFLRIFYLPQDVIPQYLGGVDALRVFATAVRFFRPPMSLSATALYPGLVNDNSKSLVALRCRPENPSLVEPILASWPNVFAAIAEDFGDSGLDCPPPSSPTPENEVYCAAKDFVDTAQPAAPISLEHAMSVGAALFDPGSPELAAALKKYYGIYPAFSGLGFSVKSSGDGHSLTALEALRQSITPEYLLKNVQLGIAGCHCVIVDAYAG